MSAWLTVTQLLPRIAPPASNRSGGAIRPFQAALLAFTFHSSSFASESQMPCLEGVDTGARQASIAKIIDGDSVELDTGEKVRIIGINAPELYPRNKREERFASAAQDRLETLLYSGSRKKVGQVTLIAGIEPTDQHGRSLYHVLLPSGKNIALELLSEGLAAQSAVSPNTRCALAFAKAESQARQSEHGIWQNPDFWLIKQRKLPNSPLGFYIVRDSVKKHRVINTKRGPAQVLSLKNGTNIFVSAEENELFMQNFPKKLTNKTIEIRGWFYLYRRKATVNFNHPANLQVLSGK